MSLRQRIERTLTILRQTRANYEAIGFHHGLGAEDMVLMDLVARHAPEIKVFVLDTGRLPEASYELLEQTRRHYGLTIECYAPQAEAVARYAAEHGINGFYRSVEARKQCCQIRRLEPLARALAGKQAWLTSLRRQPQLGLAGLKTSEWDTTHGLVKLHPLRDWSTADVWAYIYEHDIPYNSLHEAGYPLLGCAPCIRAIPMGAAVRSGRWWWEHPWQNQKSTDTNAPPLACALLEQQEPAAMA